MKDEQRAREIVGHIGDLMNPNGQDAQAAITAIAAALAEARRKERELASQTVLDLAQALRSLKAKPRLSDLAKLSKRIRARSSADNSQ